MVLAKVAVQLSVRGDGAADRGRQQPPGLVTRQAAHHAEDYLAGRELLEANALGDYLCRWRKDARDLHEVELLDACVAQRQLEARELLLMYAYAFSEKDPFRNEHFNLPPDLQ